MEVDYIINNKVSEADFEKMTYEWLIKGDYTPDDIIENAITQNNAVYVPLYCYAITYYGTCSCSLGYNRTEYYHVWDEVSKKQVRKSRTVTDWYPHSQAAQGDVVTTIYAGIAVENAIIKFVETMNWEADELHPVPQQSDHYQEACRLFKVAKEDLWNTRGLNMAYDKAVLQTKTALPSPLVTDFSLNIKYSETGFYSLLAPFWLLRYSYGEQEYHLIVDGNNPKRIDGKRPEDKKRKKEVAKLKWYGWFVGTFVTCLALYYFSTIPYKDSDDNSIRQVVTVIIGIILTAILVTIEVKKVKRKALRIRQAKLDNHLKKLKSSSSI